MLVQLCKYAYQCSFICECSSCVGAKEYNVCPLVLLSGMCCGLFFCCCCFLRCYQETDAPFTILALCRKPSAQLKGNMCGLRSHCLLISASFFCALSNVSAAAWTSHRLTTETPHFCLRGGPCWMLSFKSQINRNTCTPLVYITRVSARARGTAGP